jgi:hypothetical protein
MNSHDQAARFAVKLDPHGFLRWLLPGLDSDLVFTGWLDTQTIPFPGDPDLRCDTVAELGHRSGLGPPWALVVELQSRPDSDIQDRLLEYLARLRRELRHGPHQKDKYLLGAALVNLTGAAQTELLEMVLPGTTGLEMRWRIRVATMEKEDAVETVARIRDGQIAGCLLAWAPLMRGGDRPDTIRARKEAADQEPDRQRRGNYRGVAWIFAGLAGCLNPWREALEDWDVEESALFLEWHGKGLEEGKEIGKEIGRAETLHNNLLRTLQVRFPGTIPPELIGVIRKQEEVAKLSDWFEIALKAASLDEFRAAVGV